VPDAHRAKADVQIGERDAHETHPRPLHVPAIEAARAVIRFLAHRMTRELVEKAADDVAHRVAPERIAAQQHHVRRQYQGAQADAEVRRAARVGEPERVPHVARQNHQKQDGDIEEIAVDVLHDEREIPLAENTEALQFGRDLVNGNVDVMVFLTGVGARALLETVSVEQSCETFLQALRKTRVAARGPKPLAVMREWNVPVEITAPEPNTWRELLTSMESMSGGLHAKRVAVQEYGVSNPEFLSALRERGAIVRRVPVYQWALPHDAGPLKDAVRRVIEGSVSVVLFTTGVQAAHLFQVAREIGKSEKLREAFCKVMVASIGPTTTETLANLGVTADMEPSHPKMGILVKEAAERSAELLAEKLKA